MSSVLWRKLPEQFLRMGYPRFLKYSDAVREIIIDLAEAQHFKCAICRERSKHLVVDHDHDPDDGPGDQLTIYNIRGLVCSGCNWDLGFYEKEERGETFGWDNVECKLSTDKYETYKYGYELRVERLREAILEGKVPNYWHRRLVLDRFDRWYYGPDIPPKWYRDYKEEKARTESAEDFFRKLIAALKFIKAEFEKDPNYRPPEEFFTVMDKIRPFLEEVLASAANAPVTDK